MRLKNGHKKKFLLKDKNNVLGESWKKVSRLQRMCMLRCVWLCDSMDYSLPGSSVHGISQVRILEEVAISFSRGSSWPRSNPISWVSCISRQIFFFFFFFCHRSSFEAQKYQEADIKSDFTVYNIPLLLLFYFLYVIGGVSICGGDTNNFFSSEKSQSELFGVCALSFLGEGKLN